MKIINLNISELWTKESSLLASRLKSIGGNTLSYKPAAKTAKTYAKTVGLRSMQNIKGFERDVIEAYRAELPHGIWGDAEKMKQWTLDKANAIANKDYPSSLLDANIVTSERNDVVKEWLNVLNEQLDTRRNPFLLLKIMRFVTKELLNNNKTLAPIINPSVVAASVHETAKTGASFEKVYYRNLRKFDTSFGVKTENVSENGICGKWYSIDVPFQIEAIRQPGLFARISNYVSVLCQGSDWCVRSPGTISHSYSGHTFNVFIDNKGSPQLCLVYPTKSKGRIEAVVGKQQYVPIPQQYKSILKSFLERHGLQNSLTNEKFDNVPVIDLCK